MTERCNDIQDRLAEPGTTPSDLDAAGREHVERCADCGAVVAALQRLDQGLAALEPFDASDDVVAAVVGRSARPAVTVAPDPDGLHASRPWRRLLRSFAPGATRRLAWGGLGAAALLALAVLGLPTVFRTQDSSLETLVAEHRPVTAGKQSGSRERGDQPKNLPESLSDPQVEALPRGSSNAQGVVATAEGPVADGKLNRQEIDAVLGGDLVGDEGDLDDDRLAGVKAKLEAFRENRDQAPDLFDDNGALIAQVERVPSEIGLHGKDDLAGNIGRLDEEKKGQVAKSEVAPSPPPRRLPPPARRAAPPLVGRPAEPFTLEHTRSERVEARVVLRVPVGSGGRPGDPAIVECSRPGLGFEQEAIDAVSGWRFEPALAGESIEIVIEFRPATAGPDSRNDGGAAAREFLAGRESVEGLRFQAAAGYWANTYVPGDPWTRALEARLGLWESGRTNPGPAVGLHRAARRVGQPFDVPGGAALGLSVQADRRGVQGPGRMLLQVGLQGTARLGGRRPTLDLGIVLDLRGGIDAEAAANVRALLAALNRARRPGDRFSLFVAGGPRGCAVGPDDFRHGYLTVTLDRLLAGGSGGGRELGLEGAFRGAVEQVAGGADDADRTLGTQGILLVTAQSVAPAVSKLETLAYRAAVAGIPVSVVGIGPAARVDELERVVLAGQGNRRRLESPAGAAALVDRELAAASRTVARAVRVNVRLAPGVKLVDVIGSERLDARRTRRVKQAEESLDLRLARQMGIGSDRGADDEGIQIVLPVFQAGDSHVVLLDLVVPGPGAVADVTVRYKDLVQMRNGTARAALALDARDASPGPLQVNVLKNLLSHRLSEALDAAGRDLAAGRTEQAARTLAEQATLLQGLREELPQLAHDPEIAQDLTLLAGYRAILSPMDGTSVPHPYLADSLRYAARLKLRTRPQETAS